jgi:hypothetical protein
MQNLSTQSYCNFLTPPNPNAKNDMISQKLARKIPTPYTMGQGVGTLGH